jgi:histidine triad (HIT) family protein
MKDCVFCKIIDGTIPHTAVYEDDVMLAFHDVNPQTPVHVLIIPKMHIENAAALDAGHAALMGHIWVTIPKIAALLGVQDAFKILTNSGAGAGQTVFHLHFHLQSG